MVTSRSRLLLFPTYAIRSTGGLELAPAEAEQDERGTLVINSLHLDDAHETLVTFHGASTMVGQATAREAEKCAGVFHLGNTVSDTSTDVVPLYAFQRHLLYYWLVFLFNFVSVMVPSATVSTLRIETACHPSLCLPSHPAKCLAYNWFIQHPVDKYDKYVLSSHYVHCFKQWGYLGVEMH